MTCTTDIKRTEADSGVAGTNALAASEIISVVASVLVVEWMVIPLAGRSSPLVLVPLIFAGTLMFASARLREETRGDLGLRFDNFARAVRLLLVPMLLGTAVLIGAGWWLQRAGYGEPRIGSFLLKASFAGVGWGLLQQYVLQAYVNRRAQEVFGRGFKSILVVATVFAVLHAPNLWLCVATFFGGAMWAWVYQRAPNLFALAISHGFMTWILIASVPAPMLKGMRAGYNYFL